MANQSDTGGTRPEGPQSRGERFDEEQGGGRGPGSVSSGATAQVGGGDASLDQDMDDNPLTAQADLLLRDDKAHQDRG